MSRPLRIAFAGTPAFAVPSLQALIASDHEIVTVISQPDRPAGRGRRLQAPPVKEAAVAAGLPVVQPERLDCDAFRALAGDSADALVVVAYGQLLLPELLALPRWGAFNVHASLLPRWRGAAPIARAILAGDAETGVSIMQMTAGLDAGPVLARAATPIGAEETAAHLHDRLAELGARTLLPVLADPAAHCAAAEPQDSATATYAPKLTRAEAWIDWYLPAEQIARAVRAFQPWPVAHTELAGTGLRIHRAEPLSGEPAAAPGMIIGAGDRGIDVATGRGTLRLLEVQQAGRRVLPAGEFARARSLRGEYLGAVA